ncbi:c-type cytochrome [Pelagibacterium sp.]|uniref:c-type cytochrome n=1 Tax=Pelagibacterium sp. TaxID=1967288 RepID=UPI003BAD6B3B
MNSFELNKIFGAILGTLVFVMGVSFIADEIYAPIEGRGASYDLPEPAAEGEAGGEEAPGVPPIAARMQTASADAGESLITRCQSCHDYSPANENRTGPGIYGVVGLPIASHEGFAYSDALATLGSNGEIWDYEHLDAFLESPRNYAPGTKMSFAGLSNPEDRANLIAFLRENSDDPFPLPEAPAEEAAAPAEGEGGEEAPVEDELTAAMAAVTPEDGEALIVRCQSCHDYSPANANRVGPGIHNVVGAEIALHEGYSYSDALASLGAAGETWTPENLSAFLESPADFAPGTRMSFAGLANIEDRAALIVFLNSISDNPIDLGGAADPAGEAPEEQPAVEEVEQLNLEEAAEGDDPVVVEADAPQAEGESEPEDAPETPAN